MQLGQNTDSLLLVRLQQLATAAGRINRIENSARLIYRRRRRGCKPQTLQQGFTIAANALKGYSQRERGPRLLQIGSGIEIFEIVANLVGDAERFAEASEHRVDVVFGAGECGAQAQRDF